MYKNYCEELKQVGVVSFVPNGRSMWPFIKGGKVRVIVESGVPYTNLSVILYKLNEKYFLHRIIEITKTHLVVCGDSLLKLEIVPFENVLGVMTQFYIKNRQTNANDEKYLKKVNSYYKHKKLRKIKIKIYNFKNKVKDKLKLLLKRGAK